MKSSNFSKVVPTQFWPQRMVPLVWGQWYPQIPTFDWDGSWKHPDYKKEWTIPHWKSPPGPKLINSTTLVLSWRGKTLRAAEDRKGQTPGVPSPCTMMHLGCIFSLTRNSVWVCVFVFWKVQRTEFKIPLHFSNTLPPPPVGEIPSTQHLAWNETIRNKSLREQQPLYYWGGCCGRSHTKPSLPPQPHSPGKDPESHLTAVSPVPHPLHRTEPRNAELLIPFCGWHHRPSQLPNFSISSAIHAGSIRCFSSTSFPLLCSQHPGPLYTNCGILQRPLNRFQFPVSPFSTPPEHCSQEWIVSLPCSKTFRGSRMSNKNLNSWLWRLLSGPDQIPYYSFFFKVIIYIHVLLLPWICPQYFLHLSISKHANPICSHSNLNALPGSSLAV